MREPVTTTLGQHRYQYTPLPVSVGLRVAARLARVAGPAIARALGEAGSLSAVVESAGASGGAAAIEALCERLDAKELEALCNDLAGATMLAKGSGLVPLRDVFEVHFQGDYFGLFQWLKWSLGAEFGPLVSALKALGGDAPDASAAPGG